MSRDDVAILVTGAGSCGRHLYMEAAAIKKEHHLFYCNITKEEYADRHNAKNKIDERIKEISKIKGVAGIIVYMSCIDILSGIDISNSYDVLVKKYLRGPIAKRNKDTHKTIEQLLNEIPVTNGSISVNRSQLPPMTTDYCGVISILEEFDFFNYIAAPKGCMSCLETKSEIDKEIYHYKTNDMDIACDAEEIELAEFMKKEYNIPFITGIPVGKYQMLKWRIAINQILGRLYRNRYVYKYRGNS